MAFQLYERHGHIWQSNGEIFGYIVRDLSEELWNEGFSEEDEKGQNATIDDGLSC